MLSLKVRNLRRPKFPGSKLKGVLTYNCQTKFDLASLRTEKNKKQK